MIKLDRYRGKEAGFADLLNYAAVVDDGVILLKSGALLAGWRYVAQDSDSIPEKDREVISFRVNNAIKELGEGWALHVDVVRTGMDNYTDRQHSHFPDRVTEAIDEERRAFFGGVGRAYTQSCYIVATWLPPLLAEQKFVELMFDDDQNPANKSRGGDLLRHFSAEIDALEGRLGHAFKMHRLRGLIGTTEDGHKEIRDELLSHVWRCISGQDVSMVLPKNPAYLDMLFGADFIGGTIPKIGDNYIQTIAIEGFPLESSPQMLAKLSEMPIEYRWSTRWIAMDPNAALSQLEKYRRKWQQKVRGFFDQLFQTGNGRVNIHAQSMVQDVDGATADLQSGLVTMGYYTSVLVLMDPDRTRLEKITKTAVKSVQALGFNPRIETLNTIEAYLGTLPGHCIENVRRPLINSLNLADLLPTATIWTGEPACSNPLYPSRSPALMSCKTTGNAPFFLNLHVGDVGHTIMFGPTGAGKSTHLAMIVAQLRRYQNMTIFCFDKGMSMYPLTMACGGRHYAINSDATDLSFSPLGDLRTQSARSWAGEWIETILRLNKVDVSVEMRNEVASAIASMADSAGSTLTDFAATVQNREIRNALEPYLVNGPMGYLLDGRKETVSIGDLTVFEIEELLNLGDKYALPVLLYLFRKVETSLKGQPAVIILDEAWIMLGHEVFRDKIREWLKVLRKANCSVVMATQSLSDASRSGILDVIVESTATKIFLPNPNAKGDFARPLYTTLGLNERQIEILAEAVPKKDYYYVSSKGRRLYELTLGKFALSLVAASDKESIAKIRSLVAAYGQDGWLTHWLEQHNLNGNL